MRVVAILAVAVIVIGASVTSGAVSLAGYAVIAALLLAVAKHITEPETKR